MKAVLIRISTQEIIKEGIYPRADMGEIRGLDSDLKWLLVYSPTAPVYNPSTHRIESEFIITEVNHPDHPIHRYERVYTIIALTAQEITDLEDSGFDNDGNNRIIEGGELYVKSKHLIRRRYKRGNLTEPQFKNIRLAIIPSIQYLKEGEWDIFSKPVHNI